MQKSILNVETCYGELELEHWESIYMLFLNQFLASYKIDNSKNVRIATEAMYEGFVSFYQKTPRMLGEYSDGKGQFSFCWRWNQSRGQVIIKMPLTIVNNQKKDYYVKILKFNHRILHQKSVLYPYPRLPYRSRSIYKAWILEIFSLQSQHIMSFYWCQHGKQPENNIQEQDLSIDKVIDIINSVPDIDWESYEVELMRGVVETDKSNVAVIWNDNTDIYAKTEENK